MTGRSDLSRRRLLWAAATIGAAASTGSGAAAFVRDAEHLNTSMAAGVLDLEATASWGDTDDASLGSVSTGDHGEQRITLSVSDNPSLLWFRTNCPQCLPVENALSVRFGLDTDADGTVDRWLTDDYLSLREARERFGAGIDLGSLDPDDVWEFVVRWTVDGVVKEETDVSFGFEFRATQSRRVTDPSTVAPEWQCDDCEESRGKEISWVAFCASAPIEAGDVSFHRRDGGSTLVIETIPDTVDLVLLKFGTTLNVFAYDGQESFTTGTAPPEDTHQQEQNAFPTTGTPPRSNPQPCPGSQGSYKYEFAVWPGDGHDDGSEGGVE